ncbi:septum site-determining protein MinD [Burkholderia pseudomallei]|nr:septum site-determining protein MinD [Burkholderia pseudomallei]
MRLAAGPPTSRASPEPLRPLAEADAFAIADARAARREPHRPLGQYARPGVAGMRRASTPTVASSARSARTGTRGAAVRHRACVAPPATRRRAAANVEQIAGASFTASASGRCSAPGHA